jgi:hypothetical protein
MGRRLAHLFFAPRLPLFFGLGRRAAAQRLTASLARTTRNTPGVPFLSTLVTRPRSS